MVGSIDPACIFRKERFVIIIIRGERRLEGGKSVWIVYGKERRKGLEFGKGERDRGGQGGGGIGRRGVHPGGARWMCRVYTVDGY